MKKRYAIEIKEQTLPRLCFKPVTIDDIDIIRQFLSRSGSRSCDYSLGGIFMWIDYFAYEYCIVDDTLFIKGLSEDSSRRVAFWIPIGSLPTAIAVEAIANYCKEEGVRPLFSAVPEDKLEELTVLGGIAEELPDWADYIYNMDDLSTLKGKAYNKKRNHLNRFVADNPGYRLDKLDDSNLSETLDFFSVLDNPAEKIDPVMAEYERQQCADVLRHFDRYSFEGAVLRDGSGGIVAFTVGEVIGDTLYLHIEKMRHDVSGAGETINKLFAERMALLHPEIKYINREDDGGDPGLRYAKESYHPAFKLAKYNVNFLEQ